MAAIQLFANNATATLANTLSAAGTTIALTTGQGAAFTTPAAGQYELVTIEDDAGNREIVSCTARTGDTMTIARGQEGTTAREWPAGTKVSARITAGTLARLAQGFDNTGNPRGAEAVDLQSSRNAVTQVASGERSVALGCGCTASGAQSLAVGWSAAASADDAAALGRGAYATGEAAVAIGNGAFASGRSSVAIGDGAGANRDGNVAIGDGAYAPGVDSVAVGGSTQDDGAQAFGFGAYAQGADSFAAGYGAYSQGVSSLAAGFEAFAQGTGSCALGSSTYAAGAGAVALGREAAATGASTNAIGDGAQANVANTTALSGALIVPKAAGFSGNPFSGASAAQVVVMTGAISLKGTPSDTTLAVPSGARFFVDRLFVIVTAASGVTSQPSLRFGDGATLDRLLPATTTASLEATGDREIFTPADRAGLTALSAGFTTAATATTLTVRLGFVGILVENG